MQQQQVFVPQNEVTRELEAQTFAPSTVLIQRIYLDSVYRKFILRLAGAIQTTFTGTPVVDSFATFAALVNRVDVVGPLGRVVKSMSPYVAQQIQLLATGNLGERRASAGAAPLAAGTNPTADGAFIFGTTGQYTTVAEAIEVSLEDSLVSFGGDFCALDMRGAVSGELRIITGAYSQLQTANDATSVTYGNSTLRIETSTVESPNAPAKRHDLRETFKTEAFTAAGERSIDIPVGQRMRGIILVVRNGDAAKTLSSDAITKIQLITDSGTLHKSTTFQKLQAENISRHGINVPFASGVSRRDGFAYMDLLQNGNPSTALDLSSVKTAKLLITSAAAGSGATYTNPVQVLMHFQEYVQWR